MTLEQITDHEAQAVDRLHSYHRDKPNLEALLRILTGPMQDIEDALWDLYTLRLIDAAEDEALNVLGRIVGQERAGLSDDDYRRYIRARIATNKSKGRHEDLILVSRLVLDDLTTEIVASESDYATMVIELTGTEASDAVADILITFLRQTKSAGVRLLLYYGADMDEAFLFGPLARGSGSIANVAGATALVVFSTAGFPESGTILVAPGEATEAEHTYTGKISNAFDGLSPALAHNHLTSWVIEMSDDTGFGDTATALIGGEFISVLT